MKNKIISLKHISKKFNSGDTVVEVLKNINLDIYSGEIVAIVGASGSGKSTLMNILGCLDSPTEGSYILNDIAVEDRNSEELASLRRNYFGFIFQRYHLLNTSDAIGNVEIPAIYSGISKDSRQQKALEILTQLGLKDKATNKPNQLSGGQQQRVSIARALMNGGQVILADEPTGALDSSSGEQVMKILLDLNKQGHTIILVTHDKEVASYAERIIEIKDGEIISDHKKITKKEQKELILKNTKSLSFLQMKKDQLIESFKMAIRSIISHRLRSFLTMLGIIIGIASVVSVVALGNGSRIKILSDISSMGTNTIDIYPGNGFGDRRSDKIQTLTVGDAELLKKQVYIDSVSPNIGISGTVTYKNIDVSAQVKGVSSDYFQVKDLEMSLGQYFNDESVKNNAQYAVIDKNTQKKIFGEFKNPLGAVILINKVPLKIIGVTAEKKSAFGTDENLNIWVPYTTAMTRLSRTSYLQNITVRIKDTVSNSAAEAGIISLIKQKHGTKDFFTINTDSIRETIEKTTATLTLLISSIAIISLIVGGIGVMNIMLVSVTERTKEIGIRMAIGARQSDILQQFLIEAILVCLLGGFLGVSLSVIIGLIFNSMSTGFSMIFSNTAIICAFLCSTLIGIVFGFLPAKSASKLDPIVALSRE